MNNLAAKAQKVKGICFLEYFPITSNVGWALSDGFSQIESTFRIVPGSKKFKSVFMTFKRSSVAV